MQLEFGDYVLIEQKRFYAPNEIYLYKVIKSGIQSNAYVKVPVEANATETIHTNEMEEVVLCICCGVSEREIPRAFRVKDVKKAPTPNNDIKYNIIDKIKEINDSTVLKRIYSSICDHKKLKQRNDYAECTECSTCIGHYCSGSPDKKCHYYSQNKELTLQDGTKYQLPEDYEDDYETEDCCIFCGEPEERK